MGQYANQPDFGTEAFTVTPNDTISPANNLGGAVIYVGDISGGTELKVILTGVVAPGGGFPTAAEAITFKGLQAGTFMPVIVDYVLATGTSVTELIGVK
tara:strand:- start:7510 stop:7806 length:297 start_codon:yes stop_codon:yes gene_type:complete